MKRQKGSKENGSIYIRIIFILIGSIFAFTGVQSIRIFGVLIAALALGGDLLIKQVISALFVPFSPLNWWRDLRVRLLLFAIGLCLLLLSKTVEIALLGGVFSMYGLVSPIIEIMPKKQKDK
jgi:hypothetical protein